VSLDGIALTGALPTRHGFFTRLGGVSLSPYDSLNCSLSSQDDPDAVAANRAVVAGEMGVGPDALLGVTQVHGDGVVTVPRGGVVPPWRVGQGPRADALVSDDSAVALGVITADCGPVLFSDRSGRVVGAAHAGWRGAAGGVLEATLLAMRALGAGEVVACVGPCIGRESYEVGPDMRREVLALDGKGERFFVPGVREGHYQFDLAGYCVARLERAGVEASALYVDTLTDSRRFFSHRRRTLAGGGAIGHQISVIRAQDSNAV